MAYIKYKELTKFFNFSRHVGNDNLPKYVTDYVYEDERILVTYKTFRDFGIFTTSKIVLFDNRLSFTPFKKIYTIPYNKISALYIMFQSRSVELHFDLESGHQLKLKFVNMDAYDKVRLRLLYSYISRYVNKQEISNELINKLITDDIELKGEK